MEAVPTDPGPPPHVAVREDALRIDGRPVFLFGGELQYFRIRDPGFDAARTHALWAEKLDRARALGANLVATYVPWDYHELAPGRFDFEGPRDVARFFGMAAERGFYLIVKPGPFILGEWPYGFGSYGAIPLWWKRANRGELVRDRAGRIFRWQVALAPILGKFRNAQPSYASPAFLAATERWFAAFAAQARPFIGPGKPIVALQLDNETNLFWQDAHDIDFHSRALARWRERLRAKYGTAEALSRAYGRRFFEWAEVAPPRRGDRGRGAEARRRDWFEHQHAFVGEYLAAIRAIWERLGIREPDVLFLTNDTFQTFPIRDVVLPNGVVKNRAGLHCLDCYPRCIPLPGSQLFDRPFEPDLGAKLLDRYNDLHVGPSRFSFGIEIQGGHFGFLIGKRLIEPHKVRPEATAQTLLRLVAHGMKGISIFTIAGGLNLDGTNYDFQSAIPYDGRDTPRARVVAAVARFIRVHEVALLESRAVESPIGLLASAALLGAGYGLAGEQRIFGDVLRGLFGWLGSAGFNPEVEDVSLAAAEDLARFGALVFPCAPALPEADAAKLAAYVERGGLLVQLLDPGPETLRRRLFPHAALGPGGGRRRRRARVRFGVGGAAGEFDVDLHGAPRVEPPGDAETILRVPGERGALGYLRPAGRGAAVFLATSPGDAFESKRLYDEPEAGLEARALFLRRILRPRGIRRVLACAAAREEAYARLVPRTGESFWFVFSDHGPGVVNVRGRGLGALGLDPDARCEIAEVFDVEGRPRALPRVATGRALCEEGVEARLGEYGATVLRVARI